MSSTEFHLVTEWIVDSSVDDVWQVLNTPGHGLTGGRP